jgi:hypothetical protein
MEKGTLQELPNARRPYFFDVYSSIISSQRLVYLFFVVVVVFLYIYIYIYIYINIYIYIYYLFIYLLFILCTCILDGLLCFHNLLSKEG